MENNNITEVMKSLSELYAKKDYKKAAELLEQNSQVYDTGTYFYNLGTLKAKTGDFALARFYYEKALKDGYRSEALLNNLSFVKTKMEGDDLSNSLNFEDRMQDAAALFPLNSFLFLGALFFFLSVLWMRFMKSMRPWKIALVLLIAVLPAVFKVSYLDKKPVAIVLKDAGVYEGPSAIFEQKGTIKAGAKIRLSKINDKWAFISAPENSVGWISKDSLGMY